MMKKVRVSGLQCGVNIMAMPYKKVDALCSPTSALEKTMNAEPPGRGTEESFLTDSDSDKDIVERRLRIRL
jgi:hypothetical protein